MKLFVTQEFFNMIGIRLSDADENSSSKENPIKTKQTEKNAKAALDILLLFTKIPRVLCAHQMKKNTQEPSSKNTKRK